MKKKWLYLLLALAILVVFVSPAFASSTAYIQYVSSGKAVDNHATHGSASSVSVSQTSNLNTETGDYYGSTDKTNYGVRKTKTKKGSSIAGSMSVKGYSGSTSANYISGVSNNITVYLVVQPAVAASTGQWEIAGTWSP